MNRDEFLTKFKPRVVTVDVTNVGTFHLRSMSAGERAQYEAKAFVKGSVKLESFYSELLVRVLCDPDGKRWFTDDEGDKVNEIDCSVCHLLAEHALKINALDSSALDEAKKN